MARNRNDPDEATAQARLDEANAALEAAREAAAEAGAGLAATKTQNVPEMTVMVTPGNMVSHNDKAYYGEGYALAPDGHKGGDKVSLDGPTALSLMQLGYVQIVGTT